MDDRDASELLILAALGLLSICTIITGRILRSHDEDIERLKQDAVFWGVVARETAKEGLTDD